MQSVEALAPMVLRKSLPLYFRPGSGLSLK